MDGNGNLYASPDQKVGHTHHSSFLGGDPVAGAGEIEVRDGKLVAMTYQSGHYRRLVKQREVTTMDPNDVFGLMNQLCYRLQGVPDLSDPEVVQRAANDLINQISFLQPVEEFYPAIAFTVCTRRLSQMAREIADRHDEAEIIGFLARLIQRLDELRPWPRPAFVKRDVKEWYNFGNSKAIAKIVRPMHQINGLLNNSFDEVPAGASKLPVMILELRSGDVVALIGSVEPRNITFLLMPRDPGGPGTIIARFCEYTGFSPQEVIPLSG